MGVRLMDDVKLILSKDEKIICLLDIKKKLKKIIYVYEKTLEDTKYDYKVYVKGLLYYVAASNNLLNDSLTSIIIDLNSILLHDFNKRELKSIVFGAMNTIDHMLKKENEVV